MLSNDDPAIARREHVDPSTPHTTSHSRGMGLRDMCRSQKKEQHVQQLDLSRDADDRAPYRRWNHRIHGNTCVCLTAE